MLIAFGATYANYCAKAGPVLFVVDGIGAALDMPLFGDIAKALDGPDCHFQTLMTTAKDPLKSSWQDWKRIELG